jgi:hypothetical protein
MSIMNKKRILVTADHIVYYLIHNSGIVITSQVKAWNDTVRMAMLIDLILKPITDRTNQGLFLWMDNCGAHKTGPLAAVFEEAKVEVGFLPPNMTYILQVLDLVVNGPLKNHLKRIRAERVVKYFGEWKERFNSQKLKPEAQRVTPEWSPPKPSLKECILDVIGIIGTFFTTEKFKDSIRRSFISTGTSYKEDDGTFVVYKKKCSQGTIKIAPEGTVDAFLNDSNQLTQQELALLMVNGEDNDFDDEDD